MALLFSWKKKKILKNKRGINYCTSKKSYPYLVWGYWDVECLVLKVEKAKLLSLITLPL